MGRSNMDLFDLLNSKIFIQMKVNQSPKNLSVNYNYLVVLVS